LISRRDKLGAPERQRLITLINQLKKEGR